MTVASSHGTAAVRRRVSVAAWTRVPTSRSGEEPAASVERPPSDQFSTCAHDQISVRPLAPDGLGEAQAVHPEIEHLAGALQPQPLGDLRRVDQLFAVACRSPCPPPPRRGTCHLPGRRYGCAISRPSGDGHTRVTGADEKLNELVRRHKIEVVGPRPHGPVHTPDIRKQSKPRRCFRIVPATEPLESVMPGQKRCV